MGSPAVRNVDAEAHALKSKPGAWDISADTISGTTLALRSLVWLLTDGGGASAVSNPASLYTEARCRVDTAQN